MAGAASTVRRLLKELKSLQGDTATDIILSCPDENDLFFWRAWIQGPSDTPYAGLYFELEIRVPKAYPLQPPAVTFATRVFHPNVLFKTGEICLDLLKSAWSPVCVWQNYMRTCLTGQLTSRASCPFSFTLQSVCRSIISLLAHPEPDSPLNCDCGNLLRSGDIRGYRSLARMYTRLYAMPLPPSSARNSC